MERNPAREHLYQGGRDHDGGGGPVCPFSDIPDKAPALDPRLYLGANGAAGNLDEGLLERGVCNAPVPAVASSSGVHLGQRGCTSPGTQGTWVEMWPAWNPSMRKEGVQRPWGARA